MSEAIDRLRLPSSALDGIFGLAYFLDALVAICSGQLASAAADHLGGPTAPFAASAVIALLGGALLLASGWVENRGHAEAAAGASIAQLSPSALAVGGVQALFEGAMYLFVLVWGPLVASAIGHASGGAAVVPFGKVFACYMCAAHRARIHREVSPQSLRAVCTGAHACAARLCPGSPTSAASKSAPRCWPC